MANWDNFKAWVGSVLRQFREWFTPERRRGLLVLAVGGGLCGYLWTHPPVENVPAGQAGVRINRVTGSMTVLADGPALVIPLVHELRQYPLRDQVFRPVANASAQASTAYQSVEGLPVGVDVMVRYALDPAALEYVARRLPLDVGPQLIHPTVEGVLHRHLSKHTVREIFTGQRAEIQQAVEEELQKLLKTDGVLVRSVYFGHVDLPAEYQKGLESLLARELEAEGMQYTLQVREKEVEEKRLLGEAEKASRAKTAEAAALEEVIAAKGRAEAMAHVLPFKQKEIEQRRLEAEAQKVQRRTVAEGEAEARKIESHAEADARRTLAEADAYRTEVTSKAQLATLTQESALLAQNPLLIQKAFAEKLSERLQVIIAPPSAAGGFFAGNLVNVPPTKPAPVSITRSDIVEEMP